MNRIETTILSNLLSSEKFARISLPFLRPEFFQDKSDSLVLKEISTFFNKHNRAATKEILNIELQNRTDVSDKELEMVLERVEEITTGETTDHDWLIDQTESFCKKKSVYLAILESIKILDGKEKTQFNEDAIPKILQDALSVTFNSEVGHNYLADAAVRYDSYTTKEDKIPFDLDEMNAVTKGGMSRKALFCVSAESGGGKSIFMTHTAAAALKQGKNVLYISMEMSEEKIAERIDANLLKVNVDALKDLTKDDFVNRVEKISRKTMGKLYIKEYPTGSAHSGHFRGLLEELKSKQNFMPDLVIVDYLGICASARVKMGGTVNTYSYQKAIAEELRALAVEYNIAMLTGAQLNRSGYSNSDVEMSSVADSMGIVMTLDFFFALISTDELKEMGQVLVKVLKNRGGDVPKFVLGLNKAKMTFFSLEPSAQNNITQPAAQNKYVPKSKKEEADVPAFDRTRSGRTISAEDFKF
jgi:replicative DNA helicase